MATRRKSAREKAPLGVSEVVLLPPSAPQMVPFAVPQRAMAFGVSKREHIQVLSYRTVYQTTPLERISLIKQGIPAVEVKRLLTELNIGQSAGFKALNLSTATVNKKAKAGDMLSSEESERVIGLARLVGQLEAMIEESGDPTGFDARAWIARWLSEPLPALGGTCPIDLIDTMEGQAMVSSALAKLQSGAYA